MGEQPVRMPDDMIAGALLVGLILLSPGHRCRVARELFRQFDAAHRAPGHPEGTAAEADGRIFGHLDLEFAVK